MREQGKHVPVRSLRRRSEATDGGGEGVPASMRLGDRRPPSGFPGSGNMDGGPLAGSGGRGGAAQSTEYTSRRRRGPSRRDCNAKRPWNGARVDMNRIIRRNPYRPKCPSASPRLFPRELRKACSRPFRAPPLEPHQSEGCCPRRFGHCTPPTWQLPDIPFPAPRNNPVSPGPKSVS